MRRKDLLIIVSVLVVVAFITVFGMYYILNDGNIFSKVKDTVAEAVVPKKEYHSNGWETAIVKEIKDSVPIPVGYSYVEGNKKTGIIIESNYTSEKYIWIPIVEEINEELYEKIVLNSGLSITENEKRENMLKYNGFYIAIDEEGYELGSLEQITLNEKTKLDNETITKSIETHTMTAEELINVIAYNEELGNKIKIKNLKTLTVLGSSSSGYTLNEGMVETAEAIWCGNNLVYVPAGFTYAENQKVSEGFKITNTQNLSFIWVPIDVEGYATKYKKSEIEKIEKDTSLENDKKYDKKVELKKEAIRLGIKEEFLRKCKKCRTIRKKCFKSI